MTGSPRHFTSDYVEHAALRDGTPIVVRLLRPDDKALLRAGFEQLSPESRYARFFTPKQVLTNDELRYLTEIDQEHHFAIGALREGPGESPVGLGIARFIELRDTPGTAEAAIAVADAYQGRGLGRLLLQRLCAAARERGITTFRSEVLGSNTTMKHLLEATAPLQHADVKQGVMTLELAVPDIEPTASLAGPPPQGAIYRLFRAAAENVGDWTDAIRNLWGVKRDS